MIIYPAIDLRGGKVVRLKEGDPNRQITFSDNPVATAQDWIAQGTEWIHMVNLDGAFAEANDNGAILQQVAQSAVKVQFGGGLRSMDDIAKALDQGASRVILGTIAIEQPETVTAALERWGADAICVALDARDGKITTRGWQEKTDFTPTSLGKRMAEMGVKHALYTDVNRDGRLIGANIRETIMLGRETGLEVIASGGISSMDEIHQLNRSQVVAGVIIGMALYEGKMTLKEALIAAGAGNVN